MKPHYQIRLKQENKLDLMVWKQMLESPTVFARPFIEFGSLNATEIDMYSDASGKIGFGAVCGTSWMYGEWPKSFLDKKPTIEYLELYGLVTGVITWICCFRNRRIVLFCDNMAVVHMVNNTSARDKSVWCLSDC